MSAFATPPGTSSQSHSSTAINGHPYPFRPYPPPDYFVPNGNMPPAPMSPMGVPGMFGPMSPSSGGPGFPGPLFAHFSPFPSGSPPSPMFTQGIPARPNPPSQQMTVPEGSPNSSDTRLLRQILHAVSKMGSLLDQTDQTLNDVTVRQSSIEDRLSLMEQRILRIDSRVLEVLDQDRNTNESVRRAVVDVGHVADDVRDIRNLASDNDTQESFENRIADLVDGSISKCIAQIEVSQNGQENFENRMIELVDGSISRCIAQIDTLSRDIKEIKTLVRESAKYALMSSLIAAPPAERQRIKEALAVTAPSSEQDTHSSD